MKHLGFFELLNFFEILKSFEKFLQKNLLTGLTKPFMRFANKVNERKSYLSKQEEQEQQDLPLPGLPAEGKNTFLGSQHCSWSHT